MSYGLMQYKLTRLEHLSNIVRTMLYVQQTEDCKMFQVFSKRTQYNAEVIKRLFTLFLRLLSRALPLSAQMEKEGKKKLHYYTTLDVFSSYHTN